MNLLLVDDEDYVLDYLEEAVDWIACGIEQVYQASSVDEALDIIDRLSIDIIISDIRMPEKSGMDLLSSVQTLLPSTKFILLSGYSEFEYAKQALQYGAVDYLLKPIIGDEVETCLHKVVALIKEENHKQNELIAAKDVLRFGIPRMRDQLLLELLLGKQYSEKDLNQHLTTMRLPLTSQDPCILALLRIETDLEESNSEDWELFSYAVVNIAEELFSRHSPVPLWTCKDPHRYLVMLMPTSTMGGVDLLSRQIKELQIATKTFLKRTLSVLVSHPFVLHDKLADTYLKALNQFWSLIGTQKDVLLTLDNLEGRNEIKPLVRLHETPSLLQYMESGRWDDAIARLDDILADLDVPGYRTQEHLNELVYHLYGCFSYLAHKQGDSLAELLHGFPLSDLRHLHTSEAVRCWTLHLMDQFQRSLHEHGSNQNHVIRQIQAYISQNLQKDISLNKIGDYVYLHPVYLSRLYKKETGESLSSYITRVRIDKAAQLLLTTNKKVSDIAVEVGYHKTQYFIRLFKELNHDTPQTYRKKFLK